MGASWRRRRAAWALALAAALGLLVLPSPAAAQAAHVNLSAAYQVEDPAGDVAVAEDDLVGQLPLGDEDFSDVDLLRVYVYEDTGPAGDRPPSLVVALEPAGASDPATNYTVSFTVEKGPTSLPSSTASGTTFTRAALASGGSRPLVSIPLSQLGAVGGDLLTGLRVVAERTAPGTLPLGQDDQTGRDEAPDAGATAPPYTFFRPPPASLLDLEVVSVAGEPGARATLDHAGPVEVGLRITNLGLDADAWQLSATSTPPLADPPVFAQAFTPLAAGAAANATVEVSLQGMPEGPVEVRFTAASERGGAASAVATLVLDLPSPAAERGVRPAGLTFLTGAAEAAGFDGPFGPYAELALLALLVLLVLLSLYLLLAVAPTTLGGLPGAEAPRPTGAGAPAPARAAAGPAGVAETVSAGEAPAALFARDGEAATPAVEEGALDAAALAAALAPPAEPAAAPVPTAAAGARIRIEEVRHAPKEPEAGEQVTTEVLLRNEGATATLRVVLAVDGQQAAERTVQVPSRATRSVELAWKAGPGDNRVRISAYPA